MIRNFAPLFRKIVTGLLILVLLPIVLDYFYKTHPTAEAYETTFGSIMRWVNSLVGHPLARYSAAGLLGLTAGIWIDVVTRRFDGSRDAARRSVGYEMLDLGRRMHDRQNGFHNEWPANVANLVPEMMSLQIDAQRFDIWSPGPTNLQKGAGFIIGFYMTVGRLLSDGHFVQAQGAALQARDSC